MAKTSQSYKSKSFGNPVKDISEKIKNIKDGIKKRNLSPIYLLQGDEPYYIDLISDIFEKNLIGEEAVDFNMDVFYGKDTSASKIITACRQYPMMYDLRLVLLKEAQLTEKKEWERMLLYLTNPQPSTILVIGFKGTGFDIKCKNAIVKHGGVFVECKKIPDNSVPAWIGSYIEGKGYGYDNDVPTRLSDYLGNNLQKISNEIDKLIINIPNKKIISVEDVTENIGFSKDYNVFELQNALSVKNVVKSNEIINYFAKNPKENPIQMILPVLFSFFSKLLVASQVPYRNENEIALVLGYKSSYGALPYTRALQYYSTNQLFRIINIFNEYDLKTKGIGKSPLVTDADLLQELVFKILHV